MIIELDMSSSTPIYVQLRNQIVKGIGKGEKVAEQPVEGDEYTCDGNGQELSQRDTCRYGDEDLPQEGNPKFFHNADAFSKNRKIFPFCQGNAALSFTEVLDLNR